MAWYNDLVDNNNLSHNRFLTDYRLKKFILTANEQDYELAISSIMSGEHISFYTIFKPVDYDHIIYMSAFTKSWTTAKVIFKEIANQVISNYNINIEDYPELSSFIK
jgi:hypothetical protein